MKLTKRKGSTLAVYAIAAVMFIILTLAIPFPKSAASWVMFAFSILSLAGSCGITLFAFSKGGELKSKFYGYPVFRIGILYAVIQTVLTVVIYAIGCFFNIPYWVGLGLSVLIMGLAAIGVIATDNARDYVENVDVKTYLATGTVRKFHVDIADMLDMCKNEVVYASVKKLVEKFKYSDVVSNNETAPIEEQIKQELNTLKAMITSENTETVLTEIETLSNLLSSRNRLCENSKNH